MTKPARVIALGLMVATSLTSCTDSASTVISGEVAATTTGEPAGSTTAPTTTAPTTTAPTTTAPTTTTPTTTTASTTAAPTTTEPIVSPPSFDAPFPRPEDCVDRGPDADPSLPGLFVDQLDQGYCLGPVIGGGDDLIESVARSPEFEDAIDLVFTPAGIERMNMAAVECFERTEHCPTGRLAIMVDGVIISAPTIQQRLFARDQIQISGERSGMTDVLMALAGQGALTLRAVYETLPAG